MRQQDHKSPRLPRELINQLGEVAQSNGNPRPGRTAIATRKDRRKAGRELRKTNRVQNRKHTPLPSPNQSRNLGIRSGDIDRAKKPTAAETPQPIPKHVTKAEVTVTPNERVLTKQKVFREPKVKKQPSADDAEIAALEKKLGLTKRKKLPKAFEEDGLDDILEGLSDDADSALEKSLTRKRKRPDDQKWLKEKRRKADKQHDTSIGLQESLPDNGSTGEETALGELEDAESAFDSDEGFQNTDHSVEQDEEHLDSSEEPEDFDRASSDESEQSDPPISSRVRENPYMPPVTANAAIVEKYVPPSVRRAGPTDTESTARLRRQIQGLLNRLSEANLSSILAEVESLFQNNPRQHVTSIMIDLLISLFCNKASLNDSFSILHAALVAAIYKTVGADFGALFVESVVMQFDKHYQRQQQGGDPSKESLNLMSLVAHMYCFNIIGSNLMYDFIRLLLSKITEVNTELLLRIIKNAGSQLRQDDPLALKDIVVLLQRAVAHEDESKFSVRIKFMIDAIKNLKNNRVKAEAAPSKVAAENITRLRKTLGSLNSRTIKASEPLRVGLEDLKNGDKRGKWWLVGASWKEVPRNETNNQRAPLHDGESDSDSDSIAQNNVDIQQMASEHRMNTDIRRAIFITIMSASDYRDAHIRLLKLKLKRSQESELARVLLHCAGAEERYNPYYTFIAQKLCSEHRIKMAFQFSVWDLFKQMGERDDDMDVDDDDEEGGMSVRKTVNLGKMYGTLVAHRKLSITLLKVLNFGLLRPHTRNFVEVLLVTIIMQCKGRSTEQNKLIDIFLEAKDNPNLVQGLQHFLMTVVRHSDIAGKGLDAETVRSGSRLAAKTLSSLATESFSA